MHLALYLLEFRIYQSLQLLPVTAKTVHISLYIILKDAYISRMVILTFFDQIMEASNIFTDLVT